MSSQFSSRLRTQAVLANAPAVLFALLVGAVVWALESGAV